MNDTDMIATMSDIDASKPIVGTLTGGAAANWLIVKKAVGLPATFKTSEYTVFTLLNVYNASGVDVDQRGMAIREVRVRPISALTRSNRTT
jgi:hypothetical protein